MAHHLLVCGLGRCGGSKGEAAGFDEAEWRPGGVGCSGVVGGGVCRDRLASAGEESQEGTHWYCWSWRGRLGDGEVAVVVVVQAESCDELEVSRRMEQMSVWRVPQDATSERHFDFKERDG